MSSFAEHFAVESGASLLILQGRDQGARVPLVEPRVQLGRGPDNDFRVLDSEVSRHHVRVDRVEDAFHLTDLNSSNGTFLNGGPVSTATLRSGDQLQLGRTVFLFESGRSLKRKRVSREIDLVDDGDHSQILASVDAAPVGAGLMGASGAAAGSQMMRRLQTLYEISELVTSPAAGIDDVLQRILNRALESVAAERGCILVADPRTDEIRPRVFARRDGTAVQTAMPISTTIVSTVIANRQSIHTSDAQHDERFTSGQSILKAGIREAMCVPLQGRFELLGVLYVDTTRDGLSSVVDQTLNNRFSSEALKMLAAVGRQAALAVETNRYQTALVSAERLAAVGETVTTIAHDMKNILQGMNGGSYLIEAGLSKDDADTARRGLGIFVRNQERLTNLANDMLTFSRDRRPDLADCDLDGLIHDIGELMTPAAEERRIRLTVAGAGLDPVLADEALLHRAVLNVVTNAMDAAGGSEDAAVELRTRRSGEMAEIVVRDNGPGLTDDAKQRVFNLFESSKGAGGTGIGLAVSQKILREHGGSIEVDSRPGEGATFRLQLPARRGPADGGDDQS